MKSRPSWATVLNSKVKDSLSYTCQNLSETDGVMERGREAGREGERIVTLLTNEKVQKHFTENFFLLI